MGIFLGSIEMAYEGEREDLEKVTTSGFEQAQELDSFRYI